MLVIDLLAFIADTAKMSQTYGCQYYAVSVNKSFY